MDERKIRMRGLIKRIIGCPFWIMFNYMPKWLFRSLYGDFVYHKYPDYDRPDIRFHVAGKRTKLGKFIFDKAVMFENEEWLLFHQRRGGGRRCSVKIFQSSRSKVDDNETVFNVVSRI